ncbi:MAG TPA: hypothetical protein VN659_11340 [Pyrinomonadaceae bacterium]|nr:hypothetical protein [Pyrinomonadaceae bacterium]
MRDPLRHVTIAAVTLLSTINFSFAQRRSKPPLVCKPPVLAAVKPSPELSYQCDDQLSDYDEKTLKLPARVAAIKTLMSQLSSFSDPAWWSADIVDLGVCDYVKKPGPLTRDERHGFLGDDYLFWLFGNDHIRLALIRDPCYQTEYGGSNAFVLYRKARRVIVTQVLDGYFSRADNSVNLQLAKLNAQEIVEISTGSGGLTPSLTNYYFVIDPNTHQAVPKNLFTGDHGPTNEISSAMLFNETRAAAEPLKVIQGQTLARSFIIYVDDANGKIDDNGRTVSRKVLRWNGHVYR